MRGASCEFKNGGGASHFIFSVQLEITIHEPGPGMQIDIILSNVERGLSFFVSGQHPPLPKKIEGRGNLPPCPHGSAAHGGSGVWRAKNNSRETFTVVSKLRLVIDERRDGREY